MIDRSQILLDAIGQKKSDQAPLKNENKLRSEIEFSESKNVLYKLW